MAENMDKLRKVNLKIISDNYDLENSNVDVSNHIFLPEELAEIDDIATTFTVDNFTKRNTKKVLNKSYQFDNELLSEVFERFEKDGNHELAFHAIACMIKFGDPQLSGSSLLSNRSESFCLGLIKHIYGYLKCCENITSEAGEKN